MEETNRLQNTILEISQSYWDKQKQPLLLSGLPKLIEEQIPDYRALLNGLTLKLFILDTGKVAGYKLIVHPSQPARIAVAPSAANYAFPPDQKKDKQIKILENNRQVTLAFLDALAALPTAEIDKVIIPTSVLIKLLK